MASNQLRLWFSAFALLLFQRLRSLALRGTELATAGTIRQRFLKIGALVTVSTRRVYVRLASAFPLQKLFAQAHRALAVLAPEEGWPVTVHPRYPAWSIAAVGREGFDRRRVAAAFWFS
jgi:hypothetical protein